MTSLKPYLKRKVWKTKAGWNARVYVVAYALSRKSKAQASRDLDDVVRQMEGCECFPGTTAAGDVTVID